MLVLLTGPTPEARLLEVALNLGKRLEAELDLLWPDAPMEEPPNPAEFLRKAALQGVPATLIPGCGEPLWESVKAYIHQHRPPLVAVMMEPAPREKTMTSKTRCPVILVSDKPQAH